MLIVSLFSVIINKDVELDCWKQFTSGVYLRPNREKGQSQGKWDLLILLLHFQRFDWFVPDSQSSTASFTLCISQLATPIGHSFQNSNNLVNAYLHNKETMTMTTCVLNAITSLLLILGPKLTRHVNWWCRTAQQVFLKSKKKKSATGFETKPLHCICRLPLRRNITSPQIAAFGTEDDLQIRKVRR